MAEDEYMGLGVSAELGVEPGLVDFVVILGIVGSVIVIQTDEERVDAGNAIGHAELAGRAVRGHIASDLFCPIRMRRAVGFVKAIDLVVAAHSIIGNAGPAEGGDGIRPERKLLVESVGAAVVLAKYNVARHERAQGAVIG